MQQFSSALCKLFNEFLNLNFSFFLRRMWITQIYEKLRLPPPFARSIITIIRKNVLFLSRFARCSVIVIPIAHSSREQHRKLARAIDFSLPWPLFPLFSDRQMCIDVVIMRRGAFCDNGGRPFFCCARSSWASNLPISWEEKSWRTQVDGAWTWFRVMQIFFSFFHKENSFAEKINSYSWTRLARKTTWKIIYNIISLRREREKKGCKNLCLGKVEFN